MKLKLFRGKLCCCGQRKPNGSQQLPTECQCMHTCACTMHTKSRVNEFRFDGEIVASISSLRWNVQWFLFHILYFVVLFRQRRSFDSMECGAARRPAQWTLNKRYAILSNGKYLLEIRILHWIEKCQWARSANPGSRSTYSVIAEIRFSPLQVN